MMKNDNIFLKGLNELRAVAALGVLVHLRTEWCSNHTSNRSRKKEIWGF